MRDSTQRLKDFSSHRWYWSISFYVIYGIRCIGKSADLRHAKNLHLSGVWQVISCFLQFFQVDFQCFKMTQNYLHQVKRMKKKLYVLQKKHRIVPNSMHKVSLLQERNLLVANCLFIRILRNLSENFLRAADFGLKKKTFTVHHQG
jgi:hypothetical protein